MTLKSLGELVIFLGAVCGGLYMIWGMLRMAVVNPIRRSIDAKMEPVSKQLKTVDVRMTNLDQRMSDHIMTHGQVRADLLSRVSCD